MIVRIIQMEAVLAIGLHFTLGSLYYLLMNTSWNKARSRDWACSQSGDLCQSLRDEWLKDGVQMTITSSRSAHWEDESHMMAELKMGPREVTFWLSGAAGWEVPRQGKSLAPPYSAHGLKSLKSLGNYFFPPPSDTKPTVGIQLFNGSPHNEYVIVTRCGYCHIVVLLKIRRWGWLST